MHWIIILGIICWIIYFSVIYWYFSVPLIIAGIIIQRWRKSVEEQRKHESEQKELRSDLISYINISKSEIEVLPTKIAEAHQFLDQSEVDFRERAFAPFWDSIENAIKCLGRYDYGVREITRYSEKHSREMVKLDENPPPFELGVQTFPNGAEVSERMRGIVRQAQRDFEFATIYEQRKTNELLVAGFNSLANAIENMTDRLESSIHGLQTSITENFETLSGQFSESIESMNSNHDEAMKSAQNIETILDNVQRERRPPI